MTIPIGDIRFQSPVDADIISQKPVGSAITSHTETTLNQTAYTYDEATLTYNNAGVYYNNTQISKSIATNVDIIL